MGRPNVIIDPKPGWPGITLVRAENILNSFPRHVHDALVIGLADSGDRLIFLAGGVIRVRQGSVFVIPPGMAHSCQPGGQAGMDYRILCLDGDMVRRLMPGIPGRNDGEFGFKCAAYQDPALVTALERALRETGQKSGRVEEILRTFFYRLPAIQAAGDDAENWSGSNTLVLEKIEAYLSSHFSEPVSLEMLSKRFGISPYHLHRSFVARTGVSPHEYMIKMRIRQAVSDLRHGCSVAETALSNGFYDQSHFTRNFKRQVGVPPAAFARKNRL